MIENTGNSRIKACETLLEAKQIGLKEYASRAHGMTIISESGLYKSVMRSDKTVKAASA